MSKSTIFPFIFCLVLVACVPTTTLNNSRRTVSSTSSSTTDSTDSSTSTDETVSFGEDIHWYSGEAIDGALTINQTGKSIVYLRGDSLHSFLDYSNNKESVYCVVLTYSTSPAKKQVRARAVPISFHNYSTYSKEQLLRIDLPSESENKSYCQGSINGVSSSSDDVTFDTENFCTECTGNTISSTKVELFMTENSAISDASLVPNSTLDIEGLEVRIDTISGSISATSSCSDSSCNSKGYDCCLYGQCVNDGSLKPGATSHEDYLQALADVDVNSLNFTNWPNIYYICTNHNVVEDPEVEEINAEEVADAEFELMKKEYLCLEEGKNEEPNYGAGYCTDSSYTGITTCEGNGVCSDTTYESENTCENAGKVWTDNSWTYYCYPSGDITSYQEIQSSVWNKCGCEADPFPSDPDEPQCPDFGLQAELNDDDEITEVTCDIPELILEPEPFQNLDLIISTRSIPHRFYRSDTGESIDDLTTIDTEAEEDEVMPEGVEFKYEDDSSKQDPQNTDNFNHNAILGQMKVDLTGAIPAKMIDIEYAQTYIISATSGYYYPCTICAKDSWFTTFTALPPSQSGRGLEAIGHTTERDNYITNITMGNYEDTIFGRACWVPLTMIPFSHQDNTETSNNFAAQRENRLATQTALYVNGYQRDWFGFNLGALIGSFDGITWFAIGTGRRVQATSNKLYLAINAPFADLAENSSFNVSIVLDQGNNIAADYDYEPSLAENDARQNIAGTCQKYHQCETDADCVTQLGWEYMCAKTSGYASYVPNFDIDANESSDEIEASGFTKILQGTQPSGTKNRCVYRGAGAPCTVDYFNNNLYKDDCEDNDGDSTYGTQDCKMDRIKLLTCAPNFYCAPLSSSKFNNAIKREPNNLFTILYGQDANVMGRPKDYITANESLDEAIIENLQHNFALMVDDSSTTEVGLCRPGKSLSAETYLAQHGDSDSSKRTDFISQVASCDSDEVGDERINTCPAFDMREKYNDKDNKNFMNYVFPTDTDNNDDEYPFVRSAQNSCGQESQNEDKVSVFAAIELSEDPNNILIPSIVQNACFRRAGSVCHTNLDCSPNKMHAAEAKTFNEEYFGNTLAEQMYWEEELICGQKESLPFITSDDFSTYDLKLNRCCREIGNTLTMFTSTDSAIIVESLSNYTEPLTPPDDNPNDLSAFSTATFPKDEPSADGRYSRYQVLGSFEATSGSHYFDEIHDKDFVAPFIQPHVIEGETPYAYQWKSINETGKLSCCGGGFIRKFADGTNDWTIRNRLSIDLDEFKCLNFESEIPFTENPEFFLGDGEGNYEHDYLNYCRSPGRGLDTPDTSDDMFGATSFDNNITDKLTGRGCAQVEIAETEGYEIIPPSEKYDGNESDSLRTVYVHPFHHLYSSDDSDPAVQGLVDNGYSDSPFAPIPYDHGEPPDPDADVLFWSVMLLMDPSGLNYGGTFFYLHSYIFANDDNNGIIDGDSNIKEIRLIYYCIPDDSDLDSDDSSLPPCSTTTEDFGGTLSSSSTGVLGHITLYSKDRTDAQNDVYYFDDCDVDAWDTPETVMAGSLHYAVTSENGNKWCLKNDDDRQIVIIKAEVSASGTAEWHPIYAGIEIDYYPFNSPHAKYQDADEVCPVVSEDDDDNAEDKTENGHCDGMHAANNNYYLTKLGRLELLGIPQIFYEPLFCNANKDKVVKGYIDEDLINSDEGDDNIISREEFNAHGKVFEYSTAKNMRTYDGVSSNTSLADIYNEDSVPTDPHGNSDKNIFFKDLVKQDDIFSEHEFMCCIQLGLSTTEAGLCCSSYAIQDPSTATDSSSSSSSSSNTDLICALPHGANLNVYFNRFVSNEGVGEEQPDGGFLDSDFIPETGEIKLTESAYDKLFAMGEKYCEYNEVKPGGAFGYFPAEPHSGGVYTSLTGSPQEGLETTENFRHSIVDSNKDWTDNAGTWPSGHFVFESGYRWNHHLYCGPSDD